MKRILADTNLVKASDGLMAQQTAVMTPKSVPAAHQIIEELK